MIDELMRAPLENVSAIDCSGTTICDTPERSQLAVVRSKYVEYGFCAVHSPAVSEYSRLPVLPQ